MTNSQAQTHKHGFALRLFLVGGRFGGKKVEEQRNIILGITGHLEPNLVVCLWMNNQLTMSGHHIIWMSGRLASVWSINFAICLKETSTSVGNLQKSGNRAHIWRWRRYNIWKPTRSWSSLHWKTRVRHVWAGCKNYSMNNPSSVF